jgi:hypothetical protein
VSAPRQHIHIQSRGVCHLNEEDLVFGDGADRAQVRSAGEYVERVEHEADRRVVGPAHNLPGVPVIVDMPPPGERLERDAHPALCRAVSELVEIGGSPVDTP